MGTLDSIRGQLSSQKMWSYWFSHLHQTIVYYSFCRPLFTYLPFSTGQRSCVGKRFAQVSIYCNCSWRVLYDCHCAILVSTPTCTSNKMAWWHVRQLYLYIMCFIFCITLLVDVCPHHAKEVIPMYVDHAC